MIIPIEGFKKQYGKSWDEIRGDESNWKQKLKIWIKWVGKENSQFHNQRSEWHRKNPVQFFKNQWKEVSYATTVYYNAWNEQVGIPRESLETDIKFWLQYRKRDFKVSLKDPEKIASEKAIELLDKNLEINGYNILTNERAITKQDICDEAEARGWEGFENIKSVRKTDLVKRFIEHVEEEKEAILQ